MVAVLARCGRSLGFPFKTNEILNISFVRFKPGFQGKSAVPLPPPVDSIAQYFHSAWRLVIIMLGTGGR